MVSAGMPELMVAEDITYLRDRLQLELDEAEVGVVVAVVEVFVLSC